MTGDTELILGDNGKIPLLKRFLVPRTAFICGSILCVVIAAILGYLFERQPQLTAADRRTIQTALADSKSDTQTHGFDSKTAAYSLARLDFAVQNAEKHQCGAARAVYRDATAGTTALSSIDKQMYKNRIDDLCKAK